MDESEALVQLRQAAQQSQPAGADQRRAVVDVLDEAFIDDPMLSWVLRRDQQRNSARRHMIDVLIGAITLPMGHTYLATHSATGPAAVAAWQPPNYAGAKMGLLDQIRLAPDMMRIAGLGGIPRLLAAQSALEKHHPVREPHYYLYFLGVAPRFQGKGLGSLILEASLAPIDQTGLPCYLENSKPKNTPLYMRYGFQPVTEFRARADAPPMLAMWRKGKGL
jgi:ribosomal protein S18 acetylase RimI-like enzyme